MSGTMPEHTDHVTTSTRDHESLRARLEAWLQAQYTAGAEPRITKLTSPDSNGMSSESLLFDITTSDGATRACVARVPPPASDVPVFPSYNLRTQYDVMRLVREATDVPVPEPLWFEGDVAAIGAPFIVMQRIDGQVPPDVMPYNMGSWLLDADPADQQRLQEASVGIIAAVHGLDRAPAEYAFCEIDGPEPTPLRRHVADQWRYYRWTTAGGARQPLIERTFAWLDEHWPNGAEERPALLNWGDARIGNILYRDFMPVGVLDWEMACVAPREMDLSWMVFLHRFFEDLAAQMGLPGMPHFLRLDDVVATYERLTGQAPRDMQFFLVYAALRHAIIMSRIAQRSIHFGEAEAPDDPDDLIMHRATLEAMLDGSYWAKL
jgi:aminoglycoside phosphotransferase (APT) family kinase protein